MTDLETQIKELEDRKAATEKEIKKLKQRKKAQDALIKFEKIKEAREKIAAVYKTYAVGGISENDIKNFPRIYDYRKGRNRSNDPNADFIKAHTDAGGTIEDLKENARIYNEEIVRKFYGKPRTKKSAKPAKKRKSSTALSVNEDRISDSKTG